jgi:hypothetical protein
MFVHTKQEDNRFWAEWWQVFPNINQFLISRCTQFLFVSVVFKNSTPLSVPTNLLATYMLLLCPTECWQDGLGDTQRQALEQISGPSLGAKAKFLSFNRTQSRAVTGLLTGHNTLRRHLHLLGLLDSPLCRRCAVKEETSAHILCECEVLA